MIALIRNGSHQLWLRSMSVKVLEGAMNVSITRSPWLRAGVANASPEDGVPVSVISLLTVWVWLVAGAREQLQWRDFTLVSPDCAWKIPDSSNLRRQHRRAARVMRIPVGLGL